LRQVLVEGRSAVNTVASWPSYADSQARVLHVQTKLHKWAATDQQKKFRDLFNLVYDLGTLRVAWARVRANRGSRSAGADGVMCSHIEENIGVEHFLRDVQSRLKDGTYRPIPVRERAIPKKGGKVRRLGIPSVTDRVVQMALKLVLEPIFEPDRAPRGAALPDAVGDRVGLLSQQGLWKLGTA
jgi:RNA-directed DNA polymerase